MKLPNALFWIVLGITPSLGATTLPLKSEKPLALDGKAARFDFMATDASAQRILAAHKGAGTLEILDLQTGKPLPAIPVGEAQGVAIDPIEHRYFLGNDDGHSVAIVDARSLKKTAEIKVDGPVDAIAYDPKNGMLFAGYDDGDRLWVIDTKTKQIVTTITIPGVPEVLEYDASTDRIYQNIKTKNEIVRIDPATNKIDATWSTLPVTAPHGLVTDGARGILYTAGSNGKLVAIDLKTGHVTASADIATGVDQIAYDSERKLIYCACKGSISVVKVTESGLKSMGSVPSPQGAHTLAVNPVDHSVWVSFSDREHSYFQKFRAQP
ncbi:MAG: YncE family protein [Oligoflexia bacterium]|nr:YncE family protein [Oligoflexia bacterium]